eukprot:TRINITY_DN42_c0_g1_i6.p1 TRINITY_DN42_c0_g1~~TRINITY_DN42_c0_g1_i6.p1  ORF type:complete len:447 (+),score=128.36 TRINITY_DN42_c0_g1_i6:27-1343(+)
MMLSLALLASLAAAAPVGPAHSVWLCANSDAVRTDPRATMHVLPGSAFSVVALASPSAVFHPEACSASSLPADQQHYILRGKEAALARVANLAGVSKMAVPESSEFVVVAFPDEIVRRVNDEMHQMEVQAVVHIPRTERVLSEKNLVERKQLQNKEALINSLDGDDYYLQMEYLTGVKPIVVDGQTVTTRTRYTHTESNRLSARWIRDYFSQFYGDVFLQNFTYSGQTTQNIIAVKPGRTSEIVVVGAHMDSTSNDPNNLAPGCVDNGSGTDGVLLLAKAFAGIETERTIHFIAFGAEEQGLVGSQFYVNQRSANKYDIAYALIMDMIGYSGSFFGIKIEGTTNPSISALMEIMEDNVQVYAPALQITKTYNSYGSDHVPFQQAGLPAFLSIELDDTDYPGYHRTTDQINYLSVDQSIAILRGLAGTIWDLAVEGASP